MNSSVASGRRDQSGRPLKYRVSEIFNFIPRLVLRSSLHGLMSGGFVLLSVTGRSSGKHYLIPVAFQQHDGALLIGIDRPWRKNLRSGEWIEVWFKGNRRRAEVDVVADSTEAGRLLGCILRRNPVLSRFLHVRVAEGTPNEDDLKQAIGRGAAVIRLRLE